ncbi:hypothetical protein SSX86_007083 [Deinandra increscens subsp. villosa]|uniref:Uncharacterized protein n=1 Tax=Deinandra increscens subsp. villosa TaxID=3103831 RepID=A0AAP0DG14_9ASTR
MDSPTFEDTAFHAELTRQILTLIMDDEDETCARQSVKGGSENPTRLVVCHGSVTSGGYFSWSESGRSNVEVPGWMERLWAANGGVGTGVFIPRVAEAATVKSRRRRRNKARKNGVNYGGIFRIHG